MIPELIITLIIALVFFLILREVFLWYWRINTLVKNQEESNALLKQIILELKKNSGSADLMLTQGTIKVYQTAGPDQECLFKIDAGNYSVVPYYKSKEAAGLQGKSITLPTGNHTLTLYKKENGSETQINSFDFTLPEGQTLLIDAVNGTKTQPSAGAWQ